MEGALEGRCSHLPKRPLPWPGAADFRDQICDFRQLMGYLRVILGLYRDNGKENGNDYNGIC